MGKAGSANGTCKDLGVGQPITSKEGRGAKQLEGSDGLSRVGVRGGKCGGVPERLVRQSEHTHIGLHAVMKGCILSIIELR